MALRLWLTQKITRGATSCGLKLDGERVKGEYIPRGPFSSLLLPAVVKWVLVRIE